ncbi:retrovirus-related pol polyprotein from transposon TNT 1-94 [Tanacetum coccineum]
MKVVFENLEAEVDQNEIDLKSGEIERKNLFITNENSIAECLSKDVFYTAIDFVLNVSRFSAMHDAFTIAQKRIADLEYANFNLRNKIQNDDHNSMIKHLSKLEVEHFNLQLKYQNLKERFGNKKPVTSLDAPSFDSLFVIGKLNEQIQSRGNTIRELKEKISRLTKKNSDAYPTFDLKDLVSQNKYLTAKLNAFHDLNECFRVENAKVVQIVLWYLDSGCSKHMTGDHSRLKNFMKKFIRIVRFGNDHFSAIMGYGDYVIGDSVISRVYYIEGLGHNLFSVGQFCDSDLEVAFRKHTYMMRSSPICLLSKASKNKSWLWHHRLNHLNFGTLNDLARKDLVRGLPRLKFEKNHLCYACQLRKSRKATHKPKTINTIMFTWVKFLRSKDETPAIVINLLKQLQVGLNKTVRFVQTYNGTEFVNKYLTDYYESVGITYEKTILRTPQQNGVVERRNRTLVEAARTMLIFSKAPLFL